MHLYLMRLPWTKRIFIVLTIFLVIQILYLACLPSNNQKEEEYSPPQIIYTPRNTKPHYLSLCSVFKDEAEYITEWIQFHKLMGVERFYLYNHNSTDGVEAILAPFVNSGDVVLLPAVDVYDEKSKHRLTQTSSFEDCLNRFGNLTRWMMFMDVDEFCFPTQKASLPKVTLVFFTISRVSGMI